MLDPSPKTNITKAQASVANGWTAQGGTEIKPTDVTGPNSGTWRTTYQSPATTFTYNDPVTGTPVSSQVVTFIKADFDIETEDVNGNRVTLRMPGILQQTATGDVFFRPSATSVNDWDAITVIYGVTVRNATPQPDYTAIAKVGFNPAIKDIPILPVCFVAGTLIETDAGFVAVEKLKVGDKVLTRDNGFKEIFWIGSIKLSAADLRDNPSQRPIRISAGALGPQVPSTDLLVSPQHRVLVRSKIAQRMFGTDEVLVAAKQLVMTDGIDVAEDLAQVEYFHILFDQHEIVNSNGAATESLYTGPEALKSLGQAARDEIFALFPELRDIGHQAEAARMLTSGRMARKLAVRHVQNDRALYLS